MKNIHVLPTNKPSIPSRLFYKEQELVFSKKYSVFNGVNIYITSDEEIKEGDWYLTKDEKLIKELFSIGRKGKIILTTDQDLIKDGVQAIDDEFLEWFVKNPSCEWVKVVDYPMVEKYNSRGEYIHHNYWTLKIIIPKEEPKQICEYCKIEITKYGCGCGTEKPKQETTEQHIEFINNNIEEFDKAIELSIQRKSKQETLEEAAAEFAKNHSIYPTAQDDTEYGFINGAKWQQEQYTIEEQYVGHTIDELDKAYIKGFNEGSAYYIERMYSEEEVLKLLHNYRNHFELYRNIQVLPNDFFEWFNKNKKK